MIGDLTKQLITLASAFLTVTITFSKDLLAVVDRPTLLQVSWAGFIASVVAGIFAMMTLTGRVQKLQDDKLSFSGTLQVSSIIQIVAFGAALVLLFVVGITAIGEALPARKP